MHCSPPFCYCSKRSNGRRVTKMPLARSVHPWALRFKGFTCPIESDTPCFQHPPLLCQHTMRAINAPRITPRARSSLLLYALLTDFQGGRDTVASLVGIQPRRPPLYLLTNVMVVVPAHNPVGWGGHVSRFEPQGLRIPGRCPTGCCLCSCPNVHVTQLQGGGGVVEKNSWYRRTAFFFFGEYPRRRGGRGYEKKFAQNFFPDPKT